jgi:DNA adenine methylase
MNGSLPRGHGPSFIRWAGSKRQSLPFLHSIFPQSVARYVEPFAGSAALFFHLKPKSGLLADINAQLINAFHHVCLTPDEVHQGLHCLSRDSETYYTLRREFNQQHSTGLRSAVLFVYLNRSSFNGLWRTNLKGEFNVPYGGLDMGVFPPIFKFARRTGLR